MTIANSEVVTSTEDNLIANSVPAIATDDGTLITGQNLVRGAVLGRITASNKLTLADDTAVNGSETPMGILVHDIDASAADKGCQVYVAGSFHNDELTWDASFTAAEQVHQFDGTPIVLR